MARAHPLQPRLPGLEPGGRSARRGGSEGPRRTAEAALARMRARQAAKALQIQLALAEDERRTEEYLRARAAAVARVQQDERLDALLAWRRAGVPVGEAIARVERAFAGEPPPADRRGCGGGS